MPSINFEVKPEIADKLQAIKEHDNRSKQKEIEHLICCRYEEICSEKQRGNMFYPGRIALCEEGEKA